MQTTYRRLRLVNAALVELSTRILPTITSDLKVAARLRNLRDPIEDSEFSIRKIREELPAPEGSTEKDLPFAVREARQKKIDELLDRAVEFPDVDLSKQITEDDLPKATKTDKGTRSDEENRVGVADIVLNLDFMFAHGEE